jgi:hypothetical protein
MAGWKLLVLPCLMLAGCAQPELAASTPNSTLPAAPAVAPITLVGATTGMLSAELGPPALRRVDGTSQVWLYHTDVCALNLILFPDAAGIARVASAVPDSDPAACMASLARQTAALERPAAT